MIQANHLTTKNVRIFGQKNTMIVRILAKIAFKICSKIEREYHFSEHKISKNDFFFAISLKYHLETLLTNHNMELNAKLCH